MIASFLNAFLAAGFVFNMTVFYVELLEEFKKSKAETTLVQSVCSGVFFGAGIVRITKHEGMYEIYLTIPSRNKQVWFALILALFGTHMYMLFILYHPFVHIGKPHLV